MDLFWEEVGLNILKIIPGLLAWGFGIILAINMIRRGGSRPEKLLLVGCSLMLFTVLANPFFKGLLRYLQTEKTNFHYAAQTMGYISLPLALLSLGGIVCLALAFWLKFWKKAKETV